jgi:hypothetical protein
MFDQPFLKIEFVCFCKLTCFSLLNNKITYIANFRPVIIIMEFFFWFM